MNDNTRHAVLYVCVTIVILALIIASVVSPTFAKLFW